MIRKSLPLLPDLARAIFRVRPVHALPRALPVVLGLALLAPAVSVELSGLDLRVTDADIQPSVQLRQFDNRTVEEFSVNNQVYMLKITPAAGPPYFLIDQDGSGDMVWKRGQPERSLQVPQWTLMRW